MVGVLDWLVFVADWYWSVLATMWNVLAMIVVEGCATFMRGKLYSRKQEHFLVNHVLAMMGFAFLSN